MDKNDFYSRIVAVFRFIFYCIESLVLFFVPDSLRHFKSVRDKVVLITGAGSGIGKLLAARLAARGAVIVVWDVNEQGGSETVRQLCDGGHRAHYFHCDVSDRRQVREVASQVTQQVGQVYMLVNNAGICTSKSLLQTSDEDIERTMQVNVMSHFWAIKTFLPPMLVSKSGHVVTVASLAGLQGSAFMADYCASKFAAVGLHESLVTELRENGYEDSVKTTMICPFFINTGMFDGVKTGLLKFLDADYVASRIERAVLLDESLVIIPNWIGCLLSLKMFLSYKCMFQLDAIFKLLPDMRSFRGRCADK